MLAFNGELEAFTAILHSLNAASRQHAQALGRGGSVVQPKPWVKQALDFWHLSSTLVYESMTRAGASCNSMARQPPAAPHLLREAAAAGVDASQLLFTSLSPMNASRGLAAIAYADLFLDTVRFNASHDLTLAPRAGVPAVTCAGSTMASRMAGNILRAAAR